ncbi:hypothetical protein K440DRAFT_78420 [Wilcoxina mikolae CBS 423.85]|nr:hypothetical protein K440DRAFT_78420 [Wilcoxina mikolae CBS 423.85]
MILALGAVGVLVFNPPITTPTNSFPSPRNHPVPAITQSPQSPSSHCLPRGRTPPRPLSQPPHLCRASAPQGAAWGQGRPSPTPH